MGLYFSRPVVVVDPYPSAVIIDPYPTVIIDNYGDDIIIYDNSNIYFGGSKKNLKKLNLKELKIISKKKNIKYNNNIKKKDLYKLVNNYIRNENK